MDTALKHPVTTFDIQYGGVINSRMFDGLTCFLLSSRNDALPESMHIFVKANLALYFSPDSAPVSLALMSYILPLKGEMCSAMVSAAEGEDLASLQAKAFSAFRSACRKPTKPSCKWSFVHFIITSYFATGETFSLFITFLGEKYWNCSGEKKNTKRQE